MNITVSPDGKIQIDFHEVLRNLSPEDRIACIEDLSCHDEIIAHVTAQLLEGSTINRYSGGSVFPARSDGEKELPLDRARRQIAKNASETAAEVIDRLERAIRFYEEQEEKRRKEAEELFYMSRAISPAPMR